MEKTHFDKEPEKIQYEQITNDTAFVQLRKNIAQETRQQESGDGTTAEVTEWTADEKQFYTTLSLAEVESQFDTLYLTADAAKPTLEERIAALEEALTETEE